VSTAKEINNKLDEMLLHRETLIELRKDFDNPEFGLEDAETGEKVTKEIVLNKAQNIKDKIIEDLNKLTRNGQNCRDMFTNDYYVNDVMQDREIAEQERANKLFANLDAQVAEEN
jgi:hypothetical protein